MTLGTAYEKYLTDDIYPEDPPIEDSPTDISREDDLDDGSTYIDDGKITYLYLKFRLAIKSSWLFQLFYSIFSIIDSVFRDDGERDDPISLDLFGSK